MHRLIALVTVLSSALLAAPVAAQSPEDVRQLKLENDLLKAQLEAANLKNEKLQRENESLSKSLAELREKMSIDLFAKGAKFDGGFRFTNEPTLPRPVSWQIEITEREGETFKGVYTIRRINTDGKLVSIGINGKAPKGGSGPVIFDTEGRRDGKGYFSFSGKLNQSKVSLTFKHSSNGQKGIATMTPKK